MGIQTGGSGGGGENGLPVGLTGATEPTRYVGATTSGAPVSGTFAIGDFVIARDGVIWICTTAGTPGTWARSGAQQSGDIGDLPYTAPVLGDFTWVNQGTATATQRGQSIALFAPAVTGTQIRALVQAAPATPYTITARIDPLFLLKANLQAGLCFRDSVGGGLILHSLNGGANNLASQAFTNATTFSSNYLLTPINTPFGWHRIADNGTNRIYSISTNGYDWVTIHTIGRTDFLTADQVGFFVNPDNDATPNYDAMMAIRSWSIG
jgi:hypothetical protein